MKKVTGFFAAAAFVVAIGGAFASNASMNVIKYGPFNSLAGCPTQISLTCTPTTQLALCKISTVQQFGNDVSGTCTQILYRIN